MRAAKIPFVSTDPRLRTGRELGRATAKGSSGPDADAVTVRHRNGSRFDCGDGGRIVADALATEYGDRAQPLKRDRRTLAEFC
ncbi:hypothetical protein Halxa_2750 [Halopiger xanaduensis SH-6]|uniref:Uncharacterized protein n=1 Tax=Halopiger xanaduensis (strain DSM 18323 / JCM 14033 / SH-6) TaxID=797210 RepID=F8D3K1_HALXS|nr:hypothetical protein Halxa_2750 [Halopiger xanaduensis SH-6]